MQTPLPDINNQDCSAFFGGRWQRIYARFKPPGQCIYVFQNRDDSNDIRVLRNDVNSGGQQQVRVPNVGKMTCHACIDDPAFGNLGKTLAKYRPFEVLRYRPGKRITVTAVDPHIGPVVIKFVDRGIEELYARLSEVALAADQFDFKVSKPIAAFPSEKLFIQEKLAGKPIGNDFEKLNGERVRRMSDAIKSLHRSDASFSTRFTAEKQSDRSSRYTQLIKKRLPDLADVVDAVIGGLKRQQNEVVRRGNCFVPVHGSLHSHQWLIDGEQLALIDFDRAAMGHAELDLATFLAEFDYESATIASEVNGAFLREFIDCDIPTLNFYRAHKHLAKAFKASKHPEHDVALAKSRANLTRTMALLEPQGGY